MHETAFLRDWAWDAPEASITRVLAGPFVEDASNACTLEFSTGFLRGLPLGLGRGWVYEVNMVD